MFLTRIRLKVLVFDGKVVNQANHKEDGSALNKTELLKEKSFEQSKQN